MFIDVTNYAYEDLQELHTAGLLYFTRRHHKTPELLTAVYATLKRPDFESRIHNVGQRFYLNMEA